MSIFRRISPSLVALLLCVLTILYGGTASQWIVEKVFFKPQTLETLAAAQKPEVFQGTAIQKIALKREESFPVYGSSEFSSWSIFHPSTFFSGGPTGFYPFLIGRGGHQDFIHALNIAAQDDTLKGKKVAIVLSPQWFTPEGLSTGYFNGNFSPLHTYKFLFNPNLTPETKKQIAKRLLDYEKSFENYPTLVNLLKTYGQEDREAKLTYYLNLPVARVELTALEIKDSLKSILYLRELNQKVAEKPSAPLYSRQLDTWENNFKSATQQGQAAVTNNSFGILDDYYNTYIKESVGSLRYSSAGAKTYPSPEYGDLGLLLKVLKEQEVQPLFIIIPVNGSWYDYTGFPRNERTGYYTRVKQMIQQEGFAVADFSNKEYEKYFLKDIMHVGWKGWVYVNQSLVEFRK
jgi:D-alanine transfer protein